MYVFGLSSYVRVIERSDHILKRAQVCIPVPLRLVHPPQGTFVKKECAIVGLVVSPVFYSNNQCMSLLIVKHCSVFFKDKYISGRNNLGLLPKKFFLL